MAVINVIISFVCFVLASVIAFRLGKCAGDEDCYWDGYESGYSKGVGDESIRRKQDVKDVYRQGIQIGIAIEQRAMKRKAKQ